jgi:hypothetical protein
MCTGFYNRFLRKRLYSEKTGYILNYLTLQVNDPIMREAVDEYRYGQYRRLIYPCLFFSIISSFNTLFQLLALESSHPVHLITNFLTTLILLMSLMQIKCGRVRDCKYMLVLYIMFHVLATVLVYQDKLPHYLLGPKNIFEY